MTATVPMQRPAETSDHAAGWALVERVQAGDTDAYGQLWTDYHPAVFKFIHFRVRNRALAEDLAGDVFCRGLRSLGRVTYQGVSVGAWFGTIARNLVADYYKSGRYRLEIAHDMATSWEFGLDEACDEPGPEDLATAGGIATKVRAALHRLSDDQRRVLVLRFFRGLSVADTAAAMGRNEGAVKALQNRATCSLRRFLAADLAELR